MALHSIFGASPPPGTTTSHSDAGATAWLAQQFYVIAGPQTWKVTGVRIWLPAGSPLIGRTGAVGLKRTPGQYFLAGTAYPNDFDTNSAFRAFSEPLVAGWNDRPLTGEWPVVPGEGVLLGYTMGGGYVFNTVITTDSLRALDGAPLYLAETGDPGAVTRSFYADSQDASLISTTSRFYGLDIIADDGSGGTIPTGTFTGTYGWGVAAATGSAAAAGSFGGEYGWRPATATGSSPAGGGFASQYGFGAAVFSGAVTAGGGFTGEYGWRPATSVGQAVPLGDFSSGYRWGPAVMAGVTSAGGEFGGTYGWGPAGFIGYSGVIRPFPVCDFDLIPSAPWLNLEGYAPNLTLEGSCSP